MNSKKRNLLIGLGISLIFVLGIGMSYAYWLTTKTQETANAVKTGCFSTTFTDQNNINLTNQFPISDTEGASLTPYTFTITNTCQTVANYQVNLETLSGTTLGLSHVKTLFNKKDVLGIAKLVNAYDTATTTIDGATDGRRLTKGTLAANASVTYELRLWMDKDTTQTDGENKTYASKIVVDAALSDNTYADASGASAPELYQGMIPVTLDNGIVKVADTSTEWYNYTKQNWANAVLVNAADSSIKNKYFTSDMKINQSMVGQIIDMSDILQMYTWIPRYKYLLWNASNGSSNPQAISITFESKETPKSTGVTNGTYLTHPAFTFGATELNGIWVGKFETSGTINNIQIKPNQQSLTNLSVGDMFDASRNIENNYASNYGIDASSIDTHMMKNMEWGAVAYLSSSIYGRYTNASTCISSGCETWKNNIDTLASGSDGPSITGCAGSSVSAGVANSMSSCANGYDWSTLGQNSSVNGNTTGIYDMAGGAWEYVMGNMVDGLGNYYPSSSGLIKPDVKYFDSYAYSASTYTDHARGKLGDASKETLKTFGSKTGGWYGEYAYFPYSIYSWFIRVGNYSNGTIAGVFGFSRDTGVAGASYSFRTVLTVQ